jgi:hypothetical protein
MEGGDDCRNRAAGAGFLIIIIIIISSCCSLPLLAMPRVLLQQRPGPVRPRAIIHPSRVCFCSFHPVGIIVIITMSKIVAKGFSNQVASYLLNNNGYTSYGNLIIIMAIYLLLPLLASFFSFFFLFAKNPGSKPGFKNQTQFQLGFH